MEHNVILTERDRELYEHMLKDWLPDRILDAHVHVFDRNCFPADYEFPPKSCYRKFGCRHTIEQCRAVARLLLPDTRFSMLAFGTPDAAVDRESAARYSGHISDHEDTFALALVGPDDTVDALRQRIMENRLLGYKPYHNLVNDKPTESVTIHDMLPRPQMELADELGLVITLHIPRSGRLADPVNQEQMVDLARRYPNTRIIFAHIGRAYFMKNVVGNLDAIAACPNAYIDLAMVNHPGVLQYAFRHFPQERILFGSDAPIAWLKGKSIEVNDQYAYLMGEDYRIGTAIYDDDHAVDFTFFYYEILRGIKQAADNTSMTRTRLNALFFDNAYNLLKNTARRLHGA